MKISESEYIKIHADFCNKLGRLAIKTEVYKREYKMALGYLKKTLEHALKDDDIKDIMQAYLKRMDCPVKRVGVPLMPVFFDFGYSLQDLKTIEEILREVNFNHIFF